MGPPQRLHPAPRRGLRMRVPRHPSSSGTESLGGRPIGARVASEKRCVLDGDRTCHARSEEAWSRTAMASS